MLVWLAEFLERYATGFRVFQYITFRTILGVLTALAIALVIGPRVIRRLLARQIGQHVGDRPPASHSAKQGTPTMGGALILVALGITTLLWGDLGNRYVWIALLVTLGFGAIGFVDDYRKLVLRDSRGLAARWKFLAQSVLGLAAVTFLYMTADTPAATTFFVPFFKHVALNLGPWYLPLGWLVIVGASNGVNFTDGLDGLAILPTVMITGALAVFAYASGNSVFADYLGIPYIPGAGELAIFCGAMAGAGLGFLWFNTYPAQVFMGDVGALALGAALGVIALVVRQEIVFMVMGGVFVMETASVILQVLSFKLTGRRIFRMAPLHHHFELKGWPEPRVIVRFWIITVVLVLAGLATLKVR